MNGGLRDSEQNLAVAGAGLGWWRDAKNAEPIVTNDVWDECADCSWGDSAHCSTADIQSAVIATLQLPATSYSHFSPALVPTCQLSS